MCVRVRVQPVGAWECVCMHGWVQRDLTFAGSLSLGGGLVGIMNMARMG
jgi:hypothetical protein